jgi:hypothetical protein
LVSISNAVAINLLSFCYQDYSPSRVANVSAMLWCMTQVHYLCGGLRTAAIRKKYISRIMAALS